MNKTEPKNQSWDFHFWGEEVQGGEKWDDRYSMVEVLPFVSFQGRRLLQASLSSLIQKDETYREKEAWVVAPVAVCFELLLIHSNFHLGVHIILWGKLQALRRLAEMGQQRERKKSLARCF